MHNTLLASMHTLVHQVLEYQLVCIPKIRLVLLYTTSCTLEYSVRARSIHTTSQSSQSSMHCSMHTLKTLLRLVALASTNTVLLSLHAVIARRCLLYELVHLCVTDNIILCLVCIVLTILYRGSLQCIHYSMLSYSLVKQTNKYIDLARSASR